MVQVTRSIYVIGAVQWSHAFSECWDSQRTFSYWTPYSIPTFPSLMQQFG